MVTLFLTPKGMGINSAISISKTRKITAKRKNRREKGIRADDLGSNPHSKGESFSRSWVDRADKIRAVIIIADGKIRAINIDIVLNNIL